MSEVSKLQELAAKNCGSTDLRWVSPTGDYRSDLQEEIESIVNNPRDINFNNWCPALAAIAARGEVEAAFVLQYLYGVAVNRGYEEGLSLTSED